MHIRPELDMLRSDDAPQRTAQHAMHEIVAAWRRTGDGAAIETELARFHRGEEPQALPLLGSLFCPQSDRSAIFLAGLLQPLLHAVSRDPLAQLPLRYSISDVATGIVIARCATSALVLNYTSGPGLARSPQADTASFIPAETWDRVLAGSAQAVEVRLTGNAPDRVSLTLDPIVLQVGDVRYRHGRDKALLLRSVRSSLVQLRLQRRTDERQPVRQFRLCDGRLVHQTAGTPRDSRLELTAALLARMKRRDAAPLLAAMAEEQGADGLRWQVLRECLGLDTAIGFRALCTIADRDGDPLCAPAATLRATLLGQYPQLDGLAPCHA